MNVLFVHQNFPGQFGHLAAALATIKGNRVVALSSERGRPPVSGVEGRHYNLLRQPGQGVHHLLRENELFVLRGEAAAAAAMQIKREGFTPHVIVAHPGWGEALFLKDVFPSAKLLMYCEYYYASEGQDVGFDPSEPPLHFAQRCNLRLRNMASQMAMDVADAGLSPTKWQRSTFPTYFRDRIEVIHDGIDYKALQIPMARKIVLQGPGQSTVTLDETKPILTYVARQLEPMRGFDQFMRCLPAVQAACPAAQAVVVGGNEISYGQPPRQFPDWRSEMLDELSGSLDLSRIHFAGQIPYPTYVALLQLSRVHAYWTMPFVLSWSLLEAAASGVPVVASDTPPVREFAKPMGITLAHFYDTSAFSQAIVTRLAEPRRANTAPVFAELDRQQCIRRQLKLIKSL